MSLKSLTSWGPCAWNFLHVVAHTRPERLSDEDQERMRVFLREVAHHLPCRHCARHFDEFLDAHMTPASLATRASVVALLHQAHNAVNRRTGKRELSLAEHHRLYSSTHRQGDTLALFAFLVLVLAATEWWHSMAVRKSIMP